MSENAQYDHPWKDVIEDLFPEMLELFHVELHGAIDWNKPVEFMDKELPQIIPAGDKRGRRFVDKLVKVAMRNGGWEFLYLHVEVQNDPDQEFPERMFVYFCRLYDKFKSAVTSIAILGDLNKKWRPDRFVHDQFGCQNTYVFPMVKLLDFEERLDELERSENPFALVVMAHLKAKRTRRDHDARALWKFRLLRMALKRGWARDQIKFIDVIISLPDNLDKEVRQRLQKEEEDRIMPYLNYWERKGMEKGMKKGEETGKVKILLNLLRAKFGQIPTWVEEKLSEAEDTALDAWSINILTKDSLEEVFST